MKDQNTHDLDSGSQPALDPRRIRLGYPGQLDDTPAYQHWILHVKKHLGRCSDATQRYQLNTYYHAGTAYVRFDILHQDPGKNLTFTIAVIDEHYSFPERICEQHVNFVLPDLVSVVDFFHHVIRREGDNRFANNESFELARSD